MSLVLLVLIDTREKRLAIVERYAKEAGIPIYDESEAKRVWPPPQAGVQGMPTRTPNGARQRNPDTLESPAIAAETNLPLFPLPIPRAAGISIAVVFSGASWLLYRRLRHKARSVPDKKGPSDKSEQEEQGQSRKGAKTQRERDFCA